MRRLLFGEESRSADEQSNGGKEYVRIGFVSLFQIRSSSLPSLGKLLFPPSISFGLFSKEESGHEDSPDSAEAVIDSREPETARDSMMETAAISSDTEHVETKRSPVPSLSIPGLTKLPESHPIEVPQTSRETREPPTSKEFRRVCSEIIPGELFVSGWLVAEDWTQLESAGITHVINTACTVSKCPFPDAISYLPLAIEDSKNEDIECYFYACIDFIEEALSQGGRVLVHCMEGVSRSCSMVIAYVMWKRGLGYQEAQNFVQASRPICQPNAGFICQLLAFEKRNPEDELRRVTLRKFMEKFVLVATKCSDNLLDRRFSYIRRMGNRFEIIVSPDSPNPDFHYQLARDAIDRIARIDCFRPEILPGTTAFEFASDASAAYDPDYTACIDFLQQVPSSEQQLEEPCTARSRKSHGSIDSARDNARVRVHLILPGMLNLEPAIPYFDSDDLDSRCIYAFVLHSDVIVWLGDEAADLSPEETSGLVSRLMAQEGRRVDVQLVHQGREPEPFWDLFQEG